MIGEDIWCGGVFIDLSVCRDICRSTHDDNEEDAVVPCADSRPQVDTELRTWIESSA